MERGNELSYGVALSSYDFYMNVKLNDKNLFNIRYQDLGNHNIKLKSMNNYSVILFISHRWEHERTPDLNNTQCYIVYEILEDAFNDKELVNDKLLSIQPQGRRNILDWAEENSSFQEFLKGVGIWYDNCCIPQEPFDNEPELEELQEKILSKMDDFIVCSTVILLDGIHFMLQTDYWNRAWCFMESSVASVYAIAVLVNSTDFSKLEKSKGIDRLRTKLSKNKLFTSYPVDLIKIYKIAENAESNNSTKGINTILLTEITFALLIGYLRTFFGDSVIGVIGAYIFLLLILLFIYDSVSLMFINCKLIKRRSLLPRHRRMLSFYIVKLVGRLFYNGSASGGIVVGISFMILAIIMFYIILKLSLSSKIAEILLSGFLMIFMIIGCCICSLGAALSLHAKNEVATIKKLSFAKRN